MAALDRELSMAPPRSRWPKQCKGCRSQPYFGTLVASIASPFAAGGKGPADPVAQRFAHDEFEVAALQPRQFLGEQAHALPPGARHPRDVGTPEHPLGAECVETAMQVRMQAA